MKNFTILFLLSSFSVSHAFASEVEVTARDNSTLIFLDSGSEIPLKAETATAIDLKAPAMVTSANGVPVILVPVFSPQAKLAVKPPPLETALEKVKQEQLDLLVSQVFPEIADIQGLIRSRQNDRALEKLNSLQARYPHVKFLNFLRASLLLLKGKKDEALKLTQDTMVLYPNYAEGQQFLKKLKGEK